MRKNILFGIACFGFFWSFNCLAQQFPFDTSKYFGYYKIPDKRTNRLSIYNPYIFLSHEKCVARGVTNKSAKQAVAYWPGMSDVRHECWAVESEIVTVCPIGPVKTEEIGNACIQISQGRFADTSNIPRPAEFNSRQSNASKSTTDWSSRSKKELAQRFIKMGGCNACADNIAQHVKVAKDSRCAIVAMKALDGDAQAIDEVNSFPDYCAWKYE